MEDQNQLGTTLVNRLILIIHAIGRAYFCTIYWFTFGWVLVRYWAMVHSAEEWPMTF